jgi:hypothetical protein
VTTAANGQVALDLLAGNRLRPDLAICEQEGLLILVAILNLDARRRHAVRITGASPQQHPQPGGATVLSTCMRRWLCANSASPSA